MRLQSDRQLDGRLPGVRIFGLIRCIGISFLSLIATASLIIVASEYSSGWQHWYVDGGTHIWDIEGSRVLATTISRHEFAASYFTRDDPSQSDIAVDLWSNGFFRQRLQPPAWANVSAKIEYGLYCSPWLVIVGAGAYPIFAFIRGPFRRYRRRRRGLCETGGYNLTGNSTGVCPESGTHG